MADGCTEYTLRWKQHWKLLQQDVVTNKVIYIYIYMQLQKLCTICSVLFIYT